MPASENLTEDPWALDLVVLFEENVTQQWIGCFCNRLLAQLDEPPIFRIRSWKMDTLPNQEASEAAVAADIIFFATRRAELPSWTLNWLESWYSWGRSKPGALVIALGTEQEESPVHDCHTFLHVRSLTGKLCLDLFWAKVCYDEGSVEWVQ